MKKLGNITMPSKAFREILCAKYIYNMGPKVSRTGGVSLALGESEEMMQILLRKIHFTIINWRKLPILSLCRQNINSHGEG